MKTSERILSFCAVVITLVAIAIWIKFTRAESRTLPPSPLHAPIVTTNYPPARRPPAVTPAVTEQSPQPITPANKQTIVTTPNESAEPVRPDEPTSPPATVKVSERSTTLTKVFAGGATIRGRALLEGDAPKAKKLKLDADPQCAAMHADKPALSEEVVVNSGMLKNVFVYISAGITGTYERPKIPVFIDQKGCAYEPHVFGMQAGQPLVIKNSDDTLHNIHALPNTNEEFNKGQPAGSADLKKTFTNPDVMVKFKCDVHPWMTAYVGVLEHPFFSVTGVDGSFTIGGLPAGDYELTAWHEKYGTAMQRIRLGGLDVREIDFKYTPQ